MKMAISKLIDSNLAIDLIDTDKLFYNQYQFGLIFYLRGISAMRYHHVDLDKYREHITCSYQLRQQMAGRYIRYNVKNYGGNWSSPQIDSGLHGLSDILDLTDLVHPHRHNLKLVVSLDRGMIYSNDQSLLVDIASRPYLTGVSLRQANPVKSRNKVCLRQSKFTHRSYLKEKYIGHHDWQNLQRFLLNLQDIRLSSSFLYWMQSLTAKNRGFHSRRYWFIDHTGPAVLSMIALVSPNMIRCTLPIEVLNN